MRQHKMRYMLYALGAVGMLMGILVFSVRHYVYTINHHIIITDPSLSANVTSAIHTLIDRATTYNPAQIVEKIYAHVPVVQAIHITNVPGNRQRVEITAQAPLYSINEQWVLTNKHELVFHDVYSPACLATLPRLTVHDWDAHAPALCADLLKTLYACRSFENLYHHYNFVWHHTVDAWLYDKHDPFFAIRFNALTLPTAPLIELCTTIKKEIKEQSPSQYKGMHYVIADIRFADQIIMYAKKGEKGGWGNGTTIE